VADNLNGWGRGTWSQLGWGVGPIPVTVTGVAGTTALGSVTATGDAIIAPSGLSATVTAGTVTIATGTGTTVAVTGVAGTGEIGGFIVWGNVVTLQTPDWQAFTGF
tara:strand:+ start:3612 stop:3929 length:318 start_codon:yes stop_codon:yes gene_type:complete